MIGGLLEVASAQYYAKLREQYGRADGLMRIRTPILRFVGLVRSDYDVQYLKDGTAFSIQPNGMVIDMKGLTTGLPVRIDSDSGEYSTDHFYFLGHIGSSLEHEVWQEITGFDAISTVRGFQLARAAGAELKNYSKTATVNDRDVFLSDMGFQAAAPAPFSRVVRSIYSTTPTSWSTSFVRLLHKHRPLRLALIRTRMTILPISWQISILAKIVSPARRQVVVGSVILPDMV